MVPDAPGTLTAALGSRENSGVRADWGNGVVRCLGYAAMAGIVVYLTTAPARAADVIKGAQVYTRHCAACHGPNGISVMPGAPHLARGERLMQPDLTLLGSLKSGKNAMPAYLGILSDREILDVIAYTRTLRQ